MYSKPCYRALDRPIEFFGLEAQDWALLILACGVAMIVLGAVAGAGFALAGWFALRRIKAGKPQGHLFTLLYGCGLVSMFPSVLRPRGLLRIPLAGWGKRTIRLSSFATENDHASDQARFFWDI